MSHPTFRSMEEMEQYFYGGDIIQKAVLTTGESGVYNRVYGKRVWLQMSQEMNAFAILPKEPWDVTGFRVWRDYMSTASGVAENAAIPSSANLSGYVKEIGSDALQPKRLAHVFEVSEILEELAARGDDVIGDPLNTLKEYFGLQHVNDMNAHTCAKVNSKAWATTNDPDSIDHVVSGYVEAVELSDDGTYTDIYGIDRHTAASWADAYVDNNGGTNRDLTLELIDNAFQTIWHRGGQPKVILTGYDTQMAISQLLEANRRYQMPTTKVVPTYQGVRGIEGVEGGFVVSTYNNVPIIASRHVQNDGAGTLSRIYILDTDYLSWRVLRPTLYFEAGIRTGDPFITNNFAQKGMYTTVGNLICRRFNVQAKITHIM